jgi:hypothetical protein
VLADQQVHDAGRLGQGRPFERTIRGFAPHRHGHAMTTPPSDNWIAANAGAASTRARRTAIDPSGCRSRRMLKRLGQALGRQDWMAIAIEPVQRGMPARWLPGVAP